MENLSCHFSAADIATIRNMFGTKRAIGKGRLHPLKNNCELWPTNGYHKLHA